MPIEQFTLIGATTRFGMLTPPMRARFGIEQRLNYYPPEDLELIVHRTAEVLKVEIDDGRRDGDRAPLARHAARRQPPAAPRARLRAGAARTACITRRRRRATRSQLLDVDQFGLDDMDARILKTIIEKFDGGPVGVEHDRRRDRRGREHDRGSVRAVPRAERIPAAHAARARGDGAGVPAFRLHAAEPVGRTDSRRSSRTRGSDVAW